MIPAAQSLLDELDTTLSRATQTWRGAALQRIADLFVRGAESYGDEQVEIFDEVMGRLIPKIDRAQLAALSNGLAPLDNGPKKVLALLARHSDSAVHGPIVAFSKNLPDEDIVEIADKDRIDQKLLTKIADRPNLSEAVTDVLLKRGNSALQRKIIDNPNARISESGFARLVIGLNGDKNFAVAIAAREDLPAELRVWLDKTLEQAS